MNNILTKIKNILLTNKLLLPLIPLLFLLLLGIFLLLLQATSPVTNPPETTVTPTTAETTATPTTVETILAPTLQPTENTSEGREDTPIKDRPGIQKTETLPDGTTQYFFASPDSNRPNFAITQGNTKLFERVVITPDAPLSASSFRDAYPAPDKSFTGSHYYGPNAQTDVYAQLGFVTISDPKNDLILEEQFFPPMSVNDYLKKYGQDIEQLSN